MIDEIIRVTEPDLPSLEELHPFLEKIWESRTLTNGGAFHEEFEERLQEFLEVKNVSLTSNGTLALAIVLKALRLEGEVITTPYSFVATSNALLWNGLTPVFVDINARTLNIDPEKIEEKITSRTSAILALHCYGNPANYSAIEKIAQKYKLRVIYDAAHTFGVKLKDSNIWSAGDASIVSFHATKSFNTFEGGAVICSSPNLKRSVDYLKNFGFKDEVTVVGPGINSKMNEFCAAIGILQLREFERLKDKRRAIDGFYRDRIPSEIACPFQYVPELSEPNYSYYPIFFENEALRDKVYVGMRASNILVRRYFFPLISSFPMYAAYPSSADENLLVAKKAASTVLCLPIFSQMSFESAEKVVRELKRCAEASRPTKTSF